ncbi:MAG: HNH endonuclease, partial [Lachnospiraceae bacterium]
DNLQLAHMCCNREKSDKILKEKSDKPVAKVDEIISNRVLPQTIDWSKYKG